MSEDLFWGFVISIGAIGVGSFALTALLGYSNLAIMILSGLVGLVATGFILLGVFGMIVLIYNIAFETGL
jgi:hypothetical protein